MNGLPGIFDIFPDLTPAQAGAVALIAFGALVLLDIYAAGDEIPGNTPREVVLRWARGSVSLLGLRFTGAALAFLLGALVGHWFHPGATPALSGGFLGLGLLLAGALVLSVGTGLRWRSVPVPVLCGLSLVGALAAVFLWPVGA